MKRFVNSKPEIHCITNIAHRFQRSKASKKTSRQSRTAFLIKKDVAYFDQKESVAIIDLIVQYPAADTVMLRFFMMHNDRQGKGHGSQIIEELCHTLKTNGFRKICFGYAEGNPQSRAFLHKTVFRENGQIVRCETCNAVVMIIEL